MKKGNGRRRGRVTPQICKGMDPEVLKRLNAIPCFKGVPCHKCGVPYIVRYTPKGRPGYVVCKNCGRFTTRGR